ncbi:MAG TPA: plastocyanin/azurin family copper-binding protein [Acidimicrobiia bacterium]|jgi:plastocyanin
MRSRRTLAAVGFVLALVLTACGGGGGGGGGGANSSSSSGGSGNAPVKAGARQIDVDARSFKFTPDTIDVKAGENIAIALHSEDQTHDFVIEGKGSMPTTKVVEVQGGKTATGGFSIAQPGTYTFYCSIPGHRAAGMVGTITVT